MSAQTIEELVVSARHDSRTINVTDATSVSPDIAQLLHDAPGANVTTNGPITGIPQYRGLFGPRIAVALDNSLLAPAGPNWMDPPISYAITAQLEALEVYRGIAPVSVAQESLGGAIEARTRRIDFGDSSDFASGGPPDRQRPVRQRRLPGRCGPAAEQQATALQGRSHAPAGR
jgi:iron complex outermembrane receptor protein